MQSKDELDHWYRNADPWAYKTTQADHKRKEEILMALNDVNQLQEYDKAIDIGCGEGFVTESLPAKVIHGIEISDLAASRFPPNVIRVHEPQDKYDLVMTTGTLYQQYDHTQIKEWMISCASKHILVAGIKDWLIKYDFGKVIFEKEFSYREYTQRLVIYETRT